MKLIKTRPPKAAPPPPTLAAMALQFCLYILAAIGCFLCFILEIAFPYDDGAYLGVLGGILFFSSAYLARRWQRFVLPAGLGLLALAAFLLRKQLVAGAIFAFRFIVWRFTTAFPAYGSVHTQFSSAVLSATNVFLFFVCFLWAGYLAWAILWRQNLWLCLLGSFPVFWCPVLMYGMPPILPTGMLVCSWFALGLKGQAARRRPGASAKVSLGALLLAALYCGGMLLAFPKAGYTAWPGVFSMRSNLVKSWEALQLSFPAGSLPGTYPGSPLSTRENRLNLSQTGTLRFGSGNALRMRGDVGNLKYLRAYSAAVYNGSGWRQLPKGVYDADAFAFQPLLFTPLQFDSSLVFFYSAEELAANYYSYGDPPGSIVVEVDSGDTYSAEIQPLAGVPAHCYTPYLLEDISQEGASFTFVDDAYIKMPKNVESYHTRWRQANNLSDSILNSRAARANADSTYVLGIFAQQEIEYWDNALNSEYIAYLQDTYTQLPPGLAEKLLPIAQQAGIQPADSPNSWVTTAVLVANYLQKNFTYSTNPGPQPRSEDFAQYFLTQSKTGYCQHFATAGAVLLRALGVPARFVEGYAVGALGGSSADGWINVPAKNAHAWVEIWHPSIGWLPLEVTAGGANAAQPAARQTATESNLGPSSGVSSVPQASSSGTSSAVSSSSAASRADVSSSPNAAGAPRGGNPLSPSWRLMLRLLGAFALLLGCCFLLRGILKRRRIAACTQKNSNLAVLAIYNHLQKLGLFGKFQPSRRVRELAEKAHYSQHTLTPAEREVAAQELERRRHQMREELVFYKRWLLLLLGY